MYLLAPLSYLSSILFNQRAQQTSAPLTQNIAIKITPTVLLDIMTRYLRPQEAASFLLTCRHFRYLWQPLCKIQSLNWNHDPFHLAIQSRTQGEVIQALAYNHLYRLRAQGQEDPWKLKATSHIRSSDLGLEVMALSNGNIAIIHRSDQGRDEITIWSSSGARLSISKTQNTILFHAALPGGGLVTQGYPGKSKADHHAHIWSATLELLATINHNKWIYCIAVLPNGDILMGSRDNHVYRWSATGELLMTYTGHTSTITCIAILPNEGFVTGSLDKTAIIWSSMDNKPVQILRGHTEYIHCIAILQDGNVITGSKWGAGTDDGAAIIWSPNGKPALILKAPLKPGFEEIVVLSNGNIITRDNSGREASVCLWSSSSKLVKIFDSVEFITALPYGFITVSNTIDHVGTSTAHIWSLAGNLVATLGRWPKTRISNVEVLLNGDIAILTSFRGSLEDVMRIFTVNIECLTRTRRSCDTFTSYLKSFNK